MRGDVYDGRGFVKSSMAGPHAIRRSRPRQTDLDLDIKIGVVAGHLRRSAARPRPAHVAPRRPGPQLQPQRQDRPRHAADRRHAQAHLPTAARCSTSRPTTPARCSASPTSIRAWSAARSGSRWIRRPRIMRRRTGSINVRDFAIRGEGALDRVVANDAAGRSATRRVHAGARRVHPHAGPHVDPRRRGARADDRRHHRRHIDYARDDVNVRGTLVPLYGLNNMFGQIPIVGLFLGGGSNEGLLGITYEVTGPPEQSAADRQSDLGDRAGPAAQVLRVPRHQQRPRSVVRAASRSQPQSTPASAARAACGRATA